MKSAYLYVRVSTDEQRRKGYSLPAQEDRLLRYCNVNGIMVKGIFREDYSAKSFNRPEWKRLIAEIKIASKKEESMVLFIKWDRFSRNTELAYEMLGILRRYRTTAMAIDQPLDLTVPESTIIMAFYLSVPESENLRRGMNTSNGMLKAKQLGRFPNKAPVGYMNLVAIDGRKYIAPRQPDADIIKWSFQQVAKNCYTIEEVRRMANAKGLKTKRSGFWKLLKNLVYCGFIRIVLPSGELQLVNGIHEPLISVPLFDKVQDVLTSRRRLVGTSRDRRGIFFLKGYLSCPVCSQMLRGSFSHGRTRRYPYYHCSNGCGVRFRADAVNENYICNLQRLKLSKGAIGLFSCVLADMDINVQRKSFLLEKQVLENRQEEEEYVISKARRFFLADRLGIEDFIRLREESKKSIENHERKLETVKSKLSTIERQFAARQKSLFDIFRGFEAMDISDKKQVVHLVPPARIVRLTGEVSLSLSPALSKIFQRKSKKTRR